MTFRVGQKVVYVGGERKPNANFVSGTGPQVNQVYTVREINDLYTPFYGCPGILVAEIANRPVPWCGRMIEPVTLACYFRPVAERKTDISIFKAMLTDKRQPVSQGECP